jgi:hypothetical protein
MNGDAIPMGPAICPEPPLEPPPFAEHAVVYLEGTDAELKQMFPFGGPDVNRIYGLACVEIAEAPARENTTQRVRGVRLVLIPVGQFQPKDTIAKPPSSLIIPPR